MKRLATPALVALSLAVAICFTAGSALASGMGPFLQGNSGGLTWKFDNSATGSEDVDASVLGVGAGFSFDTNCARDELVNYRINIGLEYAALDFEKTSEDDATAGLFFDNYIGFGVLRNEKLRLWVGPEVRLGFIKGIGDAYTDKLFGTTFGVGPAAGLNLHLSRELDLALTTGIRFDMTTGSWEDQSGSTESFDGSGTVVHFTVSLLFRSLDDLFGAK